MITIRRRPPMRSNEVGRICRRCPHSGDISHTRRKDKQRI